MNGVTPTGLPYAASRSDASKFASQSENDIAAAFAELLKYEGISPARDPSPPPPASSSDARRSANENSTSPAADAKPSPTTASAANSASNEQADDEADREDDERDFVGCAVQPAATQQQNPRAAASGDTAASTEEAELQAILADAQSLQQEIDSSGVEQAQAAQVGAQAPGGEGVANFAEELDAASGDAGAAARHAVVDPAADASPWVNVPAETEVIDPQRRAGALDEEGDGEDGFAIEDLTDEGEVAQDALAELAAKAVATAETAQDGKTGDRDAEPKADRREKADAAAGIDAATQAAGADHAADASAAVLVSTANSDATSATTKPDGGAVDRLGANVSAGPAPRHETPGSLHRSIERPSDSERRHLAGVDRSRFFDRVERAFKSAEQGDGSIRMRLHPAELGAMQLTLERGDGGEWTARIQTETQEAKQTILEHAGALKERLAEQDFRLSRIEVETQADRRQQNAPDFQENPQSFSRGRDRRDDERTGEDRAPDSAPGSAAPGDRSRRLDVTI